MVKTLRASIPVSRDELVKVEKLLLTKKSHWGQLKTTHWSKVRLNSFLSSTIWLMYVSFSRTWKWRSWSMQLALCVHIGGHKGLANLLFGLVQWVGQLHDLGQSDLDVLAGERLACIGKPEKAESAKFGNSNYLKSSLVFLLKALSSLGSSSL